MPVPAAVALIPAAAGFVSNAVQAIGAGKRLRDDKEELARLTPAFYKVQDEYYQNKNSATEMAQSGITQGAKDYYTDQSSRGLGSGVSGILQAGGSPNDIARIFDSYNQGIRGVAAADSEAQINNIKYLNQVNKDLAGQKNIQWGVNEYQPYQNKLKELTQRIAADKTNINNGIQGAIGSAQAGVTTLQNNSMLSKLFGDGAGGVADMIPAGEKMWQDWKGQEERNNAAQGDYTLSNKFFPEAKKEFNIPAELMLSDEQKEGLFNFLNRGR